MNKKIFLLCSLLFTARILIAQTDSFDVFTYRSPEFFTKSILPSQIQFSARNNDTSFCIITIYKSGKAKDDIMRDVMSQWNEHVVKKLTKANKKPAKVMTEQLWDGWASTLAIGNFYQGKKKCVVMLNSFRNGKFTACVVFAMGDRIYQNVVETFSKNLHLKQ